MSDLIAAVETIRQHAHDYHLAEQYYEGSVGEVFCSAAVRRALRGATGEFDINLARRPVDAVLDRIDITALRVPGSDDISQWLVDAVWTPNRMERYAKTVHWGALTYGDCYLIVWPGVLEGTVDVHYNSPITTRVFYDPEDPRIKSYAAKMWEVGYGDGAVTRVNLYYADRIEKYVTKPGTKGVQDADFEPYQDEGEPWPIPNPFDTVPVFHFRTSEPYGRPEHRGAFGPQNAITKLSTTLMATVDFQGFPQRYGLLDPKASTDDLFDVDPDDESLAPDGSGSNLVASPGTLWKLPGMSSVGQFQPAGVGAFLEPMSAYTRWMAAATATPLRFFDPQGQIPSGEALRADEAPLAARIRDREDFFGEEWSETLRFAAHVLGVEIPVVDVQWRPVQTIDDLQGWQTVAAKIEAGVPTQQALTEAGYTGDVVSGWLEGSEKPNFDSRVDALVKIGQAMQFLGSAVQLGSVEKEQVDAILSQVLGELIRDEPPAP